MLRALLAVVSAAKSLDCRTADGWTERVGGAQMSDKIKSSQDILQAREVKG